MLAQVPKDWNSYYPKIHEDLTDTYDDIAIITVIEVIIKIGGEFVPCVIVALRGQRFVDEAIE